MNEKIRTVIPMGIFMGVIGWACLIAYTPKDFIGGLAYGLYISYMIYQLKVMFVRWDEMDAIRQHIEQLKRTDSDQ